MGRRISGSLSALALLVVGSFASSAVARPLVPAERRYSPYDAVLPACDDPAPLRVKFNHDFMIGKANSGRPASRSLVSNG